MIEFILADDNEKISVNSKYILHARPKRKDIFCDITVVTLTNGTFLEVAYNYDKVLKMIENDKI